MILPTAKEEVRKSPVTPLGLEMIVERPPLVSGIADSNGIIVTALVSEGPLLEGLINGVGFKHKTALQEHDIPADMIKWKRSGGVSSSIAGERKEKGGAMCHQWLG
ncbi:hypothetical protein Ancab_014544, partial [Ancistrocladus abbreviatus]